MDYLSTCVNEFRVSRLKLRKEQAKTSALTLSGHSVGQMPERSEGSLGQTQQKVVRQVLAGEVLLCSPSPKIGLRTSY